MPNPLTDIMRMGEGEVKTALRCAKCNQPVQAGEQHTCNNQQKENDNEHNDE